MLKKKVWSVGRVSSIVGCHASCSTSLGNAELKDCSPGWSARDSQEVMVNVKVIFPHKKNESRVAPFFMLNSQEKLHSQTKQYTADIRSVTMGSRSEDVIVAPHRLAVG